MEGQLRLDPTVLKMTARGRGRQGAWMCEGSSGRLQLPLQPQPGCPHSQPVDSVRARAGAAANAGIAVVLVRPGTGAPPGGKGTGTAATAAVGGVDELLAAGAGGAGARALESAHGVGRPVGVTGACRASHQNARVHHGPAATCMPCTACRQHGEANHGAGAHLCRHPLRQSLRQQAPVRCCR